MPEHEPKFWVGVAETETFNSQLMYAAWVRGRVVMARGASLHIFS